MEKMKRKILIIEDEPGVRENISVLLGFEGYETSTAKNGSEGIKKAVLEMPDLILCDIAMPAISGYDVLQFLKASKSTASIPLVFITAKADLKDIRLGMELGADDYLTKPFTRDELIRSVSLRVRKKDEEEQKLKNLQMNVKEIFPYELRSPVMGMVRYGELLKSQSGELSPADLYEIGEGIVRKGELINSILDQFTWFLHLDLIQSDPAHLLQVKNESISNPSAMVRDISREIAAKHGRVTDLEMAAYIEVEAHISGEMFEKMVSEVVENAFKFSGKGDKITTCTSVAGGKYLFSIVNISKGLDLKEPFRIGDFLRYNGNSSNIPGTGTGLSLVKRITALFGGELNISVVGEQFQLEILIPLKHEVM